MDLATHKFENFLHEYDTLPSTQIEAKRLATGGTTRAIITANEQTHGRGRQGREWASSSGGLYASFIVVPNISPSSLHIISMIPALAVWDFLKNELGIPAILKWPNDVLVNEKKICGILCESAIENENVRYCILGVGLNCSKNSIPSELRERACALDEFASLPDREKILFEIADRIFSHFDEFDSQKIMCEYRANCATIGRDVRIEIDGNIIFGRATEITDSGELVVVTKDGGTKKFNAADVFHATLS